MWGLRVLRHMNALLHYSACLNCIALVKKFTRHAFVGNFILQLGLPEKAALRGLMATAFSNRALRVKKTWRMDLDFVPRSLGLGAVDTRAMRSLACRLWSTGTSDETVSMSSVGASNGEDANEMSTVMSTLVPTTIRCRLSRVNFGCGMRRCIERLPRMLNQMLGTNMPKPRTIFSDRGPGLYHRRYGIGARLQT